jgi:ElaA protein
MILFGKSRLFRFTVDELYAVIKARVDVFVVEQDCPYPDLDGYDQKAIHLWAEKR